jgi:3-oxoacyl-[acyl-carrier protein] reductase
MTSAAAQPVPRERDETPLLTGRVAVVCGATGHIGGAVATVLAEMGARVGVHCHHRVERATELVRALPGAGGHAVLAGDLSEFSSAARVFEQAQEQLGAPPAVVVDAAYPAQPPRFVRELDDAYVERHLAALRGQINVCRAVVGGMRELGWGRIVLLSGALAWRPFPGFGVYGAMKAAATAFARTLALEEGRSGVTVNTLALGRIEYEGGEGAFTPHPDYEALDEITQRRVALPRMASPLDVAATVRYLASPASEAVTGQVIFLAAGEPI